MQQVLRYAGWPVGIPVDIDKVMFKHKAAAWKTALRLP